MYQITNPGCLARAIRRGLSARVPVLMIGDSTVYTNGGWQQGLAESLRQFAPLYGTGVLGMGGFSINSTLNSPGADNWVMMTGAGLSGTSGFASTGADATREAIFKYFSGRTYAYMGSGSGGQAFADMNVPFGGLDLRRAMRSHIWGAQFTSGGGAMQLLYRLSGGTTYAGPFTLSAVGTDGRLHITNEIVADSSRSTTVGHEFVLNYSAGGTPKLFWHGLGVEAPLVTRGFAITTYLCEGGRSSANCLDLYLMRRVSGQEVLQQVRELNGSNGLALFIINQGLNDRNQADAAHVQNGLIVSATATTAVLAGVTGNVVGQLLTHGYIDGSSVTQTESKTITAWNSGTQTATVSTWSVTPSAGDAFRVAPQTTTVQSRGGYYTDIKAMITMCRADAALAGLEANFLVIPAWQPASPPDNVYGDGYYDAAAQLAEENMDVCAARTDAIVPNDQLFDLNMSDSTHIGGHSTAAVFTRIVTRALLGT